jgi:hypothetical protein
MKKIYLVTQGNYSDYHVVSAFSEKALAQSFIDSFVSNEDDSIEIEEYEIDKLSEQLRNGYKAYSVLMEKDGNYIEVEQVSCLYPEKAQRETVEYSYHKEYMTTSMFAKDEKHAVKIANERRIRAIMANHW